MKLPNKVTSYKESVLSKLPKILNRLSERHCSPYILYLEVKESFSDVTEYIDALDCLYALHVVEFDDEKGVIHYAM